MGERFYLSTMAALLSRLVRDQGRDEEALELSKVAEAATASDDIDSQAMWRSIRAPIVARAGNLAEAESLARSAHEFASRTEALVLQADCLVELASVLTLAGNAAEARRFISQSIKLYAAKGNHVAAAATRHWAERMQIG
jgi:ATP/maltotriose-dependent transcriptional regulator MalT